MRRTKNVLMVVAGIAIGMLISVPAVSAASEYLTAIRSTQTFYMDGHPVSLEAYSINGNNYIKLRDIGQAVNFNVSYDAQANSVRIDPNEPYSEDTQAATVTTTAVMPTTPPTETQDSYTISVDHWSREDFSQQANPAVFTGYYDRELYNAIRQSLLDGTSQTPAYTMVAKGEDYSAAVNVLGRMSGVQRYEHHTPNNYRNCWQYLDYLAVSSRYPKTTWCRWNSSSQYSQK